MDKVYHAHRLLGGLRSWTKIIFPDTLTIRDHEVHVLRRTWLGLGSHEDTIHADRIASVRLRNGLFCSALTIETTGGGKQESTVPALRKPDAREAREIIAQMVSASARR